jgi:uncharacterized membrane protein (UPF0182 family)
MRRRIIVLIVLVILAVILARVAGIWTDFMWFASHGQGGVFWTLLLTRYGVGLPVFLVVFLFFMLNLWYARRNLPRHDVQGGNNRVIDMAQNPFRNLAASRVGLAVMLAISIFLALVMGAQAGSQWELVQKFLHYAPFGQADPVFGLDIGFYIFKLPFYELIQSLLASSLVLALFLAGLVYFFLASREFTGGAWRRFSPVKLHLALLAAGLLIAQAWDYRLRTYLLLFKQHQSFWGAGYTDVNVMLPVLNILGVLALAAAAAVLIGIIIGRLRPIVLGLGALIVASLLLGTAYPWFVQKFTVEPNEFSMEQPYLERNIAATRAAYGLDRIQILASLQEMNGMEPGQVDEAVLEQHANTLANLRLWDYRPLAQVYTQLQQLRRYYSFTDVDVDRYQLGENYRQVMLSARELDQNNLPDQAQTWVNRRLQYTHGYGVVMSPVNENTASGLPTYLISDIPPRSSVQEFSIDRPAIYYGELNVNPVVVNSKAGGTGEFDYPAGDQNVYTNYQGTGGVAMNSWWHRFAYAARFSDMRLLLSTDITPDSRILYYRTVQDIRRLAPYLQYDADPYPVVSGGRLYWFWDAYTTADRYPYSAMHAAAGGQLNYMRNSVKAVMDAYDGKITLYISDPDDPVIQVYNKIFPGLYQPLGQMPDDLRAHLRYPVDFFNTQAAVYTSYHVTDPRVFYNWEDAWALPNEKFSGATQPTEPYYTILKLPGGARDEFVLVTPFTPLKRDNLVGWMAARCDGENYGQLVVYPFPKDVNAYGPMQVEASIDQDAVISQQITLWDQSGSNVIRGNLITVPLAGKLLYVEPLFLQAQQSSLPEMKRVIVFYEGRAAMDNTLGDALNRLFGVEGAPQIVSPGTGEAAGGGAAGAGEPGAAPGGVAANMQDLVRQANELYAEAQSRLKAGDWTGYGQAIDSLGQVLRQIQSLAGEPAQ